MAANSSADRKEPVKVSESLFAVQPRLWCPHLEEMVRSPLIQFLFLYHKNWGGGSNTIHAHGQMIFPDEQLIFDSITLQ